jgi:YVTN family beta-propeller protein
MEVDEFGYEIEYDEDGYQIVYDRYGYRIGYDEYGREVAYDADGYPVSYDEHGRPVGWQGSTAAVPGSRSGPGGDRRGAAPPALKWLGAGLVVLLIGWIGVSVLGGDEPKGSGNAEGGGGSTTTAATSSTVPASTTSTLPPDGKTAAQRTMTQVAKITEGDPRPKSIVYSGGQYFFAQNMMYAHTVTVYDRSFKLVKTIPDAVDLASFGHAGYTGVYQGAPVEAAFTSDGKYGYISQYQMFGAGFDNPGDDKCSGAEKDESFVYRISTETLQIDQVIKVGAVPKYVAVTPDNSKILVSNWCSYDLSVIDANTGAESSRIDIGRFPRGIAVSPDSKTAYVAIMGGTDVAVVDLTTGQVGSIPDVGDSPRHLVLSPDGATLYATLNGSGKVAKIDVASRSVTTRVSTGAAPRSMAISDDGTALYVVNYNEDTVSKLSTSDMSELVKLPTDHHPIGIAYDPIARSVWVACYVGSILVFKEA